jgi:hypothetical protein
MARPSLDYDPVIINIKLCLHPEFDSDLVAWFESLPQRGRATAVITRLRSGTVMETAVNGQVGEDEAIATLFGMTM